MEELVDCDKEPLCCSEFFVVPLFEELKNKESAESEGDTFVFKE